MSGSLTNEGWMYACLEAREQRDHYRSQVETLTRQLGVATTALDQCADGFDSGPCTVQEAHHRLAIEFQHRQLTAATAIRALSDTQEMGGCT